MIPRAKKPKKKSIHKPTKTPYEYVKATNFLNVSAMVRTLATSAAGRLRELQRGMQTAKTATQRRSYAVQYAAKISQEQLDRKRLRRGTD